MLMTSFDIDFVGISDKGLVRDHNEDVWSAHAEIGLFILADGMGGHAAGEIAAHVAVESLERFVSEWKPATIPTEERVREFFKNALIQVNAVVHQKGQKEEGLRGMGTTLCALYFFGTSALLAHVGDSRIYRVRDQILEPLTRDHSLIAELLASQPLRTEEPTNFPYKHILTRAIGTQSQVEPTVNVVDVFPHDLFLLCSDGLSNYVSDEEIAAILQTKHSLSVRSQKLVDLAKKHGGGDNITLILADIGS